MRKFKADNIKNQEEAIVLDENIIILDDRTATGKRRPWRQKKTASVLLSKAFKRLGEIKKAFRILACGSVLGFGYDVQGEKRLLEAYFCRERLCPMCAWRRSLKVFSQVSAVMDLVFSECPTLVPLFLTLTMRNTDAEGLSSALDRIFGAWTKVMRLKSVKSVVVGRFRALEVTRNAKEDTYHPHIHAILLVSAGYFDAKKYMKTEEWVQLWRQCLGIDYDPICDIRRIKIKDAMSYKTVAEVSKYTVKDNSYIVKDESETDRLVAVFSEALKRRRLYAFGGVCKEAAKRLMLDDVEKGDFIHVGDGIRADVLIVVERYKWHIGIKDYVKEK
jgi:plasmid rolling circle replication initiator protein Rep